MAVQEYRTATGVGVAPCAVRMLRVCGLLQWPRAPPCPHQRRIWPRPHPPAPAPSPSQSSLRELARRCGSGDGASAGPWLRHLHRTSRRAAGRSAMAAAGGDRGAAADLPDLTEFVALAHELADTAAAITTPYFRRVSPRAPRHSRTAERHAHAVCTACAGKIEEPLVV